MINNKLMPIRVISTRHSSLRFSPRHLLNRYCGIDFLPERDELQPYIFQWIHNSRMSSRRPPCSSFLSCVASLKNLYSSDLHSTINRLNTLHNQLRRAKHRSPILANGWILQKSILIFTMMYRSAHPFQLILLRD